MAFPRSSIRDFLVHARLSLKSAIDNGQRVTLVIGNESADLDSLTASLLYSYLRSSAPPKQAFTSFYIPVTNIPAEDIKLRPEFLELLPHAGLEPQHLITLGDLPNLSVIQDKLAPENTRIILVDHNALQGKLGAAYAGQVCGVIDHHDEENKVPKDTGDEPRIIKRTGSCTSLVVEYLRESWLELSRAPAPEENNWDAQLAKLALATVLIDTTNLTAKQKTTEHDVEVVKYLEAKIKSHAQEATSFDRTQFFEEIDHAKKDIGGLRLHDILRKDYKQWSEQGVLLGISSVVKPLGFLQKKAKDESSSSDTINEAFLDSVLHFAQDRKLEQFAIMTTSSSSTGELQRELLLWAFTSKGVKAAKHFLDTSTQKLGLEDWQGGDGSLDEDHEDLWRKVWWQRRVENSRKQVAPLLREALAKL